MKHLFATSERPGVWFVALLAVALHNGVPSLQAVRLEVILISLVGNPIALANNKRSVIVDRGPASGRSPDRKRPGTGVASGRPQTSQPQAKVDHDLV